MSSRTHPVDRVPGFPDRPQLAVQRIDIDERAAGESLQAMREHVVEDLGPRSRPEWLSRCSWRAAARPTPAGRAGATTLLLSSFSTIVMPRSLRTDRWMFSSVRFQQLLHHGMARSRRLIPPLGWPAPSAWWSVPSAASHPVSCSTQPTSCRACNARCTVLFGLVEDAGELAHPDGWCTAPLPGRGTPWSLPASSLLCRRCWRP